MDINEFIDTYQEELIAILENGQLRPVAFMRSVSVINDLFGNIGINCIIGWLALMWLVQHSDKDPQLHKDKPLFGLMEQVTEALAVRHLRRIAAQYAIEEGKPPKPKPTPSSWKLSKQLELVEA